MTIASGMAGGMVRLLLAQGCRVTFACTPPREPDHGNDYAALTEETWGRIGVNEKIIMPEPICALGDQELTDMIADTVAHVQPDVCFIQPADDYMLHHVRFAGASFHALCEGGRRVNNSSSVKEIYAMECPAACYTRVDFSVDIDTEGEEAYHPKKRTPQKTQRRIGPLTAPPNQQLDAFALPTSRSTLTQLTSSTTAA